MRCKNPQVITWIKVISGKEYKGRYGSFPHSDMIGKRWGFRVGILGDY